MPPKADLPSTTNQGTSRSLSRTASVQEAARPASVSRQKRPLQEAELFDEPHRRNSRQQARVEKYQAQREEVVPDLEAWTDDQMRDRFAKKIDDHLKLSNKSRNHWKTEWAKHNKWVYRSNAVNTGNQVELEKIWRDYLGKERNDQLTAKKRSHATRNKNYYESKLRVVPQVPPPSGTQIRTLALLPGAPS